MPARLAAERSSGDAVPSADGVPDRGCRQPCSEGQLARFEPFWIRPALGLCPCAPRSPTRGRTTPSSPRGALWDRDDRPGVRRWGLPVPSGVAGAGGPVRWRCGVHLVDGPVGGEGHHVPDGQGRPVRTDVGGGRLLVGGDLPVASVTPTLLAPTADTTPIGDSVVPAVVGALATTPPARIARGPPPPEQQQLHRPPTVGRRWGRSAAGCGVVALMRSPQSGPQPGRGASATLTSSPMGLM